MKEFKLILILIICLFLGTCNGTDTGTTNNYYSTSDNTSTSSVIIYPISYSSVYGGNDFGDIAPNYCYGTDSSGFTAAPFYSTSTIDLKDRLPSSKWSNTVYSRQGHIISTSWESLWDGNIDMSLHEAEVIADNDSTGELGFWTGTKSDGTFSGDNCRDWSSDTSTDNGTWGSFLTKESSIWIDNSTVPCNYSRYVLCFKYD